MRNKSDLKQNLIFLLRILPSTLKAFFSDLIRWFKYSIKDNSRANKQHSQARILLVLHALEKGMSFQNSRKNFGKEKAQELFERTVKYVSRYGKDDFVILSLGVLSSFIENPNSGKTDTLINEFESLLIKLDIDKAVLLGGVKPVSKKVNITFESSFDELYDIASCRVSVRDFSATVEITKEEVLNAIKYAQTAPSVCNRQASKVYAYSKNLDSILETQLGNQGWAHKANKLFVVTTDLNFFGSVYERNQAYIDGGMFAMQFVMGLHTQKIATCCKMYIRKPNLDERFYKVTQIPQNEIPIMLILSGHYRDETVNVPISYRFDQNRSLIINE